MLMDLRYERSRYHFLSNLYLDIDSQNAFALHNTMLDERPIKIQLSEAGKKKSANKKNILKQKNRKLAEMRNEV